ncbi:hypothetical protein [Paraburkholderia sp. A1RO-1]|uniref:hypothetical protein n=1 Tax=Paraburkholderia sp. A1RO-1 TaxID=3028368 RepID=UPI003B7DED0E
MLNETTTAASNLIGVVQIYKNGASYLSNRLAGYVGAAASIVASPQVSGIVIVNGSTDYLEV